MLWYRSAAKVDSYLKQGIKGLHAAIMSHQPNVLVYFCIFVGDPNSHTLSFGLYHDSKQRLKHQNSNLQP